MSAAWLLVLLVPLPLALATASRRWLRPVLALAPLAPVPALALALTGGTAAVRLEAVLLGARVGLEGSDRVFVVLAALVWIAGAVFMRSFLADDERLPRFAAFFLLAMTGSLALPAAQDVVSFYALFSLISFSGYGLVAHSTAGRGAGRIYIAYAVAGETLLLGGLLLAGHLSDGLEAEQMRIALASSDEGSLAAGLMLAGFGVKAAAVPLHSWAPIAYAAAPVPAAAVLSGAMAKAGLLGWLRFLPAGEAGWPVLGAACVALGLTAVYAGAAAGATQSHPKPALAYSSVSQVGLMLSGVGVALLEPRAWPAAFFALTLFALHHALAKASLFLGAGVAERGARGGVLLWIGLAVPALAIAGLPLTSGALVKDVLKEAVELSGSGLAVALVEASGVASALVLGRALILVRSSAPRDGRGPGRALWAAWLGLVATLVAVPFAAPRLLPLGPIAPYSPSWEGAIAGLWPIAAGLAILAAGELLRRAWPALAGLAVVPGDLAVPLARAAVAGKPTLAWVGGLAEDLSGRVRAGVRSLSEREIGPDVAHVDRRLAVWIACGALAVLVGAILFATLLPGAR